MKMDLDCIRDILLCVEENATPETRCPFVKDFSKKAPAHFQEVLCTRYDNKKLIYHVQHCIKAELISEFTKTKDENVLKIIDLTLRGHAFAARIRSETNWGKVKSFSVKTNNGCLDDAIELAAEIATLERKKYLETL